MIKSHQVCDGVKDCECDWTELGEDENYYICPPNLKGMNFCCVCLHLNMNVANQIYFEGSKNLMKT